MTAIVAGTPNLRVSAHAAARYHPSPFACNAAAAQTQPTLLYLGLCGLLSCWHMIFCLLIPAFSLIKNSGVPAPRCGQLRVAT